MGKQTLLGEHPKKVEVEDTKDISDTEESSKESDKERKSE